MDLRAHGELASRRRLGDSLDDLLSRAQRIGLLANFPAAFGVRDDVNAGKFGAHAVHVLRQKALMHGTMSLPQDYAGAAQAISRLPAHDLPRIPDRHVAQRNAQRVSSVAAEMLIGQEQNFVSFCECPLKSATGVRGGADDAAAAATKCFYGS